MTTVRRLPLYTKPPTEEPTGANVTAVQRPSLVLFGAEPVRAAMELVRHVWSVPSSAARGDGHPIVIFPGLGAGAASLTTLLKHCRGLGYDAMDWGEGVNRGPQGDLDDWLERLAERIGERVAHHTQPATVCMRASSAS